MNLTDILPKNAEELHKLYHIGGKEDRKALEERRKRLIPFADCFKKCLTECGPITMDPVAEFSFMMMTVTLIDYMIEKNSKNDAVI